jgi:twitching motility protein PilT
VHTQDAPSAVDRVIDVFPASQQSQIRVQVASTLQGVMTQNLLPTIDGTARVPAVEILLPDDAVRNLIRQGKLEQVYTNMQTGSSKGMQTMEQSLADLVLGGVVAQEIAMSRSSRPQQLIELIQRGRTGGQNVSPLAARLRTA